MKRWRIRLEKELVFQDPLEKLSDEELISLMNALPLTSRNHDTVISLDFPHYCIGATEGCGGENGWCYTFQGPLANQSHHKKVALNDVLAKKFPQLFASKVVKEVNKAKDKGEISYPNLRFSGSGEASKHHVEALGLINSAGVSVWGFSRNIVVANKLRDVGVYVQISCDKTSSSSFITSAIAGGFSLAYTSTAFDDTPPIGTNVVFPLHRSGRVSEVVDTAGLCPKVVEEFFSQQRRPRYCQAFCNRCHSNNI